MPYEQWHPEFIFELLDLPAQRWLREAQFGGCAADAAGARNTRKIAQLAKLNERVSKLCSSGIAYGKSVPGQDSPAPVQRTSPASYLNDTFSLVR